MELTASLFRFTAAFTSRSCRAPHAGQDQCLTDSGSRSRRSPHAEQVLLLGYQRSATTTTPPRIAVLYSTCRRNSRKPASATARGRWRFASIPRTFRSSMPIVWNRRVRSVVNLCSASARELAAGAFSRATFTFTFALRRSADLFCCRDRLRESRARRPSRVRCAFGPTTVSPVESTASADTRRSTPTAPWFSATGRCDRSCVSTLTATSQRSAVRETVAETILPVTAEDGQVSRKRSTSTAAPSFWAYTGKRLEEGAQDAAHRYRGARRSALVLIVASYLRTVARPAGA